MFSRRLVPSAAAAYSRRLQTAGLLLDTTAPPPNERWRYSVSGLPTAVTFAGDFATAVVNSNLTVGFGGGIGILPQGSTVELRTAGSRLSRFTRTAHGLVLPAVFTSPAMPFGSDDYTDASLPFASVNSGAAHRIQKSSWTSVAQYAFPDDGQAHYHAAPADQIGSIFRTRGATRAWMPSKDLQDVVTQANAKLCGLGRVTNFATGSGSVAAVEYPATVRPTTSGVFRGGDTGVTAVNLPDLFPSPAAGTPVLRSVVVQFSKPARMGSAAVARMVATTYEFEYVTDLGENTGPPSDGRRWLMHWRVGRITAIVKIDGPTMTVLGTESSVFTEATEEFVQKYTSPGSGVLTGTFQPRIFTRPNPFTAYTALPATNIMPFGDSAILWEPLTTTGVAGSLRRISNSGLGARNATPFTGLTDGSRRFIFFALDGAVVARNSRTGNLPMITRDFGATWTDFSATNAVGTPYGFGGMDENSVWPVI